MADSAELVLILQLLNDVCPSFAESKAVPGILGRLFGPNGADAIQRATWLLATREVYGKLCGALFNSDDKDNAIEVLQRNGYFLNGNPGLLKDLESKFDAGKARQFYECLMWSYLDRRVPRDALTKVIGEARTRACSDPEAALCMWINTCTRRHAKLAPITAITQHFFGRPHFRAVLYKFVRESSLLDFSQDPVVNAEVGLARAAALGLQAPFSAAKYRQQPLIIMCFLFRCVAVLADVEPPKPPAVIKGTDMTSMLVNIEQAKRDVAAANKRVSVLNVSVRRISHKLAKLVRPMSQMAKTSPGRRQGGRPRPQTSLAMSSSGKRVSWDIPDGERPEGEAPPADDDAPVEIEPDQATPEEATNE